MKKKDYLCIVMLLVLTVSYSQVNVTVDIEEQRFLNETSSIDRSKFFVIHSLENDDPDIVPFLEQYNVGQGRRFFGPFAFARQQNGGQEVGVYPDFDPGTLDNKVRGVRRIVSTIQPKIAFRYNIDMNAAADWAVEYWLDNVDTANRPEFWEPMNEPFVHAGDPEFSADQPDNNKVIERMTEFYAVLGKRVQETPELANMKMVGFSSAFPSMEIIDFGLWESRMKLFIDRAGEYMDAISVHTYDGVNLVGQDTRRSGSNSEAILDLIETYTKQKFGVPKPLAITEYGIIEKGFPAGYNEAESAISIRGINSMLFNFFEREDNVSITIPFITGKSNFFYDELRETPYVPALFRPLNQLTTPPYTPSNWVPSYKENFYKLWSDVKGNRNFIQSDDFDIQAQSFVDEDKVYIALNNLDDANKTVSLSMLSGTTGITNVNIKSLKVFTASAPSYTVTDMATLPSSITLSDGETIVIAISYDGPQVFTKSIVRKKYYGEVTSSTVPTDKAPTISIAGNTAITFSFDNVDLGMNTGGSAILRLGVGIPLKVRGSNPPVFTNLDRLPSEVLVNGQVLAIPTNWKGYDQDNRDDFFGVIEIPVDKSILQQGTNTASVKYTQSGGRISSVVLSVENKEGVCTPRIFYADKDKDGLGDPNETIESCSPVQGFVDNADDLCLNDIDNLCIGNVPGFIEAENFQLQNVDIQPVGVGNAIGFINDGEFTEYKIIVEETDTYVVNFSVGAETGGGTITILSDGVSVGTLNINSTGSFRIFETFTTTINLQQGIHDLRLVYNGTGNAGGFLFDIDFIIFEKEEVPTSAIFTVKNTGETCADSNNGKINITADKTGDYTVGIVGQGAPINFNSTREISDLNAGLYTLNIADNTTGDTFEFKVEISEPQSVAAAAMVSKALKQVTLDLSGGEEYRVNFNGLKFTTREQRLTLSLSPGKNNISVKAELDCQGEYKKTITLFDQPLAYPNPVGNELTINLGNDEAKKVTITIYDISGRLVDNQIPNVNNDNLIKLSTTHLNPGMYFVKMETNNTSSTFKITK